MVDRQRALIADGDWVAEGRDIGTVVAPDAPLKVFLDRLPRRARPPPRRCRPAATSAEVLAEQARARRAATASASTAPLRAAADAVALDTTGLDLERGRRADRRRCDERELEPP